MAPSTERHQLVEIEVRAPVSPLHQVVHVKAAACAAGLAPPTSSGKDGRLDRLPLLDRGGGAARGTGTSSTASLPRRAVLLSRGIARTIMLAYTNLI